MDESGLELKLINKRCYHVGLAGNVERYLLPTSRARLSRATWSNRGLGLPVKLHVFAEYPTRCVSRALLKAGEGGRQADLLRLDVEESTRPQTLPRFTTVYTVYVPNIRILRR